MKISFPETNIAHAGAGEVLVCIDGVDAAQTLDLTIVGGDSTLEASNRIDDFAQRAPEQGHKRLRGQTAYTVNVAPCFRELFDVQPLDTNVPVQPAGRTFFVGLRGEAAPANFLMLSAGTESTVFHAPAHDCPPRRTLAVGENSELAVFTDPNTIVFEGVSQSGAQLFRHTVVAQNRGMVACPVSAVEGTTSMTVTASVGGAVRAVQHYDIVRRGRGAVRLAWQNPHGAVDFYTFDSTLRNSVKIDRTLAQNVDGIVPLSTIEERSMTLLSRNEEPAVLLWLAQILAAPRVWLCNADGTFTPVNVMTSKAEIVHDSPGRFEVELSN